MNTAATTDQQTLLEATWGAFRAQIVAGSQHLVLPDNLPSSIISTIADRYSSLLNGPVSTIAIPSLQIIRFTPYTGTASLVESSVPSSTVTSPASSSDAVQPKAKVKIPRPPNAFILYRQAYHPIIKKDFPGIANNDISKKVAALWKAESDEMKAAWKAKAEEVKQAHMKQHPGYSYQPRKSHEKKRRMTSKKLAALQAQAAESSVVGTRQMSGLIQMPLPEFMPLAQDPRLMEFKMSEDPTALDHFNSLIEQHNSSQPAFNLDAPSAAVATECFQFGFEFTSAGSLGDFGGAFAVENVGMSCEPLLSAGTGNAIAEQQRHESLGDEVTDWSAFINANELTLT